MRTGTAKILRLVSLIQVGEIILGITVLELNALRVNMKKTGSVFLIIGNAKY